MAPRTLNLPDTSANPVAVHPDARRGRGAVINSSGRFETETRETRDEDSAFDDGWGGAKEAPPTRTKVGLNTSRTILARKPHPTFLLIVRSIRIAAASMAAIIVSRGRPMRFSVFRRILILRPACMPNPIRARCLLRRCTSQVTSSV